MSETFPPLTDFNDLAAAEGLEAVRAQVAEAMEAPPPALEHEEEVEDSPAPASRALEWPAPILPGMRPVPEIGASVLPGWLGDMARAVSESTQTPPALAVLVGLSVLSTVLQRRYVVAPFGDGYTEPLSIWTLSASPSGTRKSAVLSALQAPLIHWEKLLRDRMRAEIARVNAARMVAKKRIERLQQDAAKAKDAQERASLTAEIEREETDMPDELRAPRLFTGDTTAERLQALLVEHGERMAVLSDEAGIFQIMAGLYNGGASNLDVFLQGHAGSSLRVDRAGRCAHVDQPALSFGLLLQPGVLAEVASSRRFRDTGLMARFLFAIPVSTVGKRDVRQHAPIPDAVRDGYERQLMQLLEGVPAPVAAPHVLMLDDAAREVWLDFAQAIEDEQGEGGQYEAISDWTSKLPGAVARIAALLQLAADGLGARTVGHAAMDDAIALGRLLIPHAQAAFALLGSDQVDVDADAVLRWARGRGEPVFLRSDCHRAMSGRFRDVERLKKALDRLEGNHVLQGFVVRERGRKPAQHYRLNPACYLSS